MEKAGVIHLKNNLVVVVEKFILVKKNMPSTAQLAEENFQV